MMEKIRIKEQAEKYNKVIKIRLMLTKLCFTAVG